MLLGLPPEGWNPRGAASLVSLQDPETTYFALFFFLYLWEPRRHSEVIVFKQREWGQAAESRLTFWCGERRIAGVADCNVLEWGVRSDFGSRWFLPLVDEFAFEADPSQTSVCSEPLCRVSFNWIQRARGLEASACYEQLYVLIERSQDWAAVIHVDVIDQADTYRCTRPSRHSSLQVSVLKLGTEVGEGKNVEANRAARPCPSITPLKWQSVVSTCLVLFFSIKSVFKRVRRAKNELKWYRCKKGKWSFRQHLDAAVCALCLLGSCTVLISIVWETKMLHHPASESRVLLTSPSRSCATAGQNKKTVSY